MHNQNKNTKITKFINFKEGGPENMFVDSREIVVSILFIYLG